MTDIDIFEFWARMRWGEKIHPADVDVFKRLNPEKHGFQLECLPASFWGPLRRARLVLLYLSPGFEPQDIEIAKTNEGRDRYARRWQGNEPIGDASVWARSRVRLFGDWDKIRDTTAILNIGAYHSKTFNDYSVLAALPSSRVSLGWAQRVLFPQAEDGKRIVVCLRAASYWGLEVGKRYGQSLFAPLVTRSGHLQRNEDNERLVELVQATL